LILSEGEGKNKGSIEGKVKKMKQINLEAVESCREGA